MGRRKYNRPDKIWVENHGYDVWWEDPHSKGYTEYYRKDILEKEKEKHGKAMLHVLNKGVKQGKKEMLEKAIEWLEEHGKDYWWNMTEQSLEDFRKAMEG